MLKSTVGILIALLLLLPAYKLEAPTETFPKATDSWGRPVWYNTVVDTCQNANWRVVDCPRELQLIVDKPE
ncbi:hypothetical protein [Fodinibius sp.]|uniref:hypothetical protein n=1 Tax=Fodinibius sp. TaxID=1872440 RepID=UPI002ACE4C62|nr:hypothetical protein [Fodinibius sp.]MDZ7658060.1 hypothetical protein [Fodinibius sp.]